MAKKIDPIAKRAKKQAQLLERIAKITNVTTAEAEQLLRGELVQSIRLNPLAATPEATLKHMRALGWQGEPVNWCEYGYSIQTGFEALRDSELVKSGALYIQNEASWLPVMALDPQPGEIILDLCAAPGGKTSHIAALMKNEGELIANDNSKPRLLKLQANMERLSAKAEYTLHDATRFDRTIEDLLFDKILLDAPCSGEGLISLSREKSLDTWSVAHIRRLASLQKRLILTAWRLLKPGGRLVYSTCTMAPEENEAVIDWLLRRAPDAKIIPLSVNLSAMQKGITSWNEQTYDERISQAVRLLPKNGREAFFTCVLERQISTDMS
jgi:16S rRNA (cytosine1407-C5)-methyltransferase